MSGSEISPLRAEPIALAVGDEMPATTVGPLTRTDFVRYAGAGGDLNPIHHDEPFAQAAGFPTVFGMGMLPAGMLGTHLARWVGPFNLRAFRVRFTAQVWPGDVLTFSGTVEELLRRDAEHRARIILRVTRQTGEEVAIGSALAVVMEQ